MGVCLACALPKVRGKLYFLCGACLSAEWFLSQRDTESSKPAFSNRPSSTILVVADYSTGATASVVQTKLGPLVGEGMGMPSMAGNIRIRKFEELLDGKGAAPSVRSWLLLVGCR